MDITFGHREALGEVLITLRPWFDAEDLCFNSFSATKIRNIHDKIWNLYITSSVEDRQLITLKNKSKK